MRRRSSGSRSGRGTDTPELAGVRGVVAGGVGPLGLTESGPAEPAAARSAGREHADSGARPPECADMRASRVVRPPWKARS